MNDLAKKIAIAALLMLVATRRHDDAPLRPVTPSVIAPSSSAPWGSAPFTAPSIAISDLDPKSLVAEIGPHVRSNEVASETPSAMAESAEAPPPTLRAIEDSRAGAISESVPRAAFSRVKLGDPSLTAKVAFVGDLFSEDAYFVQGTERRWPIASLTKLMSSVIAERLIDPDAEISIAQVDFSSSDTTLNRPLKVGETYHAKDLVKAMLIFSSNEAAEALSRYYGRVAFLEKMNELALQWGMKDTHFDDPTGLSSANQSTTGDLKRLAREVYSNYPELFALTREPEATFHEISKGRVFSMKNIDLFAGRPDFIGGKTGYTDDAGGNLLTVFSFGGRPVFFLVMGTADRFGETEALTSWFRTHFKRS